MRAPWTRLEHLGGYLARTQSAKVALMKPGADCDPHEAFFLRVWSDNDWAERAKDRKSHSSLKIEIVFVRFRIKHAHIQAAKLSTMVKFRPPGKQC